MKGREGDRGRSGDGRGSRDGGREMGEGVEREREEVGREGG